MFTQLEARRQQFTHYIEQVLTFASDTPVYELGEVCTSISAGGDRPRQMAKGQTEPSDEFPYPVYSNGSESRALYGFANSFNVAQRAVTVSARGTIGYHAVREPEFTAIVRLLVLVPNTELLSAEFLNRILDITPIGYSGGSIPQLTVPAVKKFRSLFHRLMSKTES